jgi:hypothetical protein
LCRFCLLFDWESARSDEGDNEGDVLESTMVADDESVFLVVPDTVPSTPRAVVPIDVDETFKRPSSVSFVSVNKSRRRLLRLLFCVLT